MNRCWVIFLKVVRTSHEHPLHGRDPLGREISMHDSVLRKRQIPVTMHTLCTTPDDHQCSCPSKIGEHKTNTHWPQQRIQGSRRSDWFESNPDLSAHLAVGVSNRDLVTVFECVYSLLLSAPSVSLLLCPLPFHQLPSTFCVSSHRREYQDETQYPIR